MIYTKKCDICGKVVKSLNKRQCNYNFQLHHASCIEKLKKEDKNGKSTNAN